MPATTHKPTLVHTNGDAAPGALRTDPELAGLIPPPAPDERARLEASLRAEGCRDPLVVWAGRGVLLDGHNRYSICIKYKIPFRVTLLELADLGAARAWVIAHQMARRNLTAEAVAYLRGQRYIAEKQSHGGDRRGPSGHSDPLNLKTAERLGRAFQVSAKTIRRDGQFALAVDELARACGADVKPMILTRDACLSRGDVVKLSRLEPAEQKRIVARVRRAGRRVRGLWSGNGFALQKGRRLVVPRRPGPLAQALVERLGPAGAAAVLDRLTALLRSERESSEAKPSPTRRKPR